MKKIAAVSAGLAVIVAGSLGMDLVLHATGVYPPWGQPMSDRLFLLATAYRVVLGVIGSYVTTRMLPGRPMWLVLGTVGLVMSTLGAVATWDRGPEFGPHWYALALIATAMPCSWAGAKLARERLT